MNVGDQVLSRRSIEALRAGVPNRDAVRHLGCSQPQIEQKFRNILAELPRGLEANEQVPGLLLTGDFGSGKSHLLQYLEHLALRESFVVSKIVISKETSLANPGHVYRAAIEEARVEDRIGPALEVVSRLLRQRFNQPPYAEFYQWAVAADSRLSPHFPASLYVFERGGDEAVSHQMIRFWSGDPLRNTELRNVLKQMGAGSMYALQRLPKERELALQRFRFATRMMAAAGYKGWILLIDETELVRYYSYKTRARAYAELARWLGGLSDAEDGVYPGLAVVATIINTFDEQQLNGNDDINYIPNKLRSTGREDDALLATQAERGMRLIRDRREPLSRLDRDQVERTFREVRRLYSTAFAWPAPDIDIGYTGLASEVMRRLVRPWITEWDLLRLYPESKPELERTPLPPITFGADDPDIQASADQ